MRKLFIAVATSVLLPAVASAVVVPIPITGFNQDVVVDTGTTGPDLRGAITATMDAGTAETGGTFYQTGFVVAAPTTGLPTGTVVTSATGNGTFALQPANVSNAVLLNNAAPTSTLTLTTPGAFSQLAFYGSTGNGSGTVNFTINFTGGATETGSFVLPDWFNSTPVAYNASGRVNNVETGTTDNVGSNNPRVYEALVNVANTTGTIQSINLTRATAGGNSAVFALSGQPVPEPASLGLLGLGVLGLLNRRRRTA